MTNAHNAQMIEEQFQRGMADREQGKPCSYGCHFGLRSNRAAWMAAYEAGYNTPRKLADSHIQDFEHYLQYGSEAEEAAMHHAEAAAENAWLRAAEYGPEAQDEMDRDDHRCIEDAAYCRAHDGPAWQNAYEDY